MASNASQYFQQIQGEIGQIFADSIVAFYNGSVDNFGLMMLGISEDDAGSLSANEKNDILHNLTGDMFDKLSEGKSERVYITSKKLIRNFNECKTVKDYVDILDFAGYTKVIRYNYLSEFEDFFVFERDYLINQLKSYNIRLFKDQSPVFTLFYKLNDFRGTYTGHGNNKRLNGKDAEKDLPVFCKLSKLALSLMKSGKNGYDNSERINECCKTIDKIEKSFFLEPINMNDFADRFGISDTEMRRLLDEKNIIYKLVDGEYIVEGRSEDELRGLLIVSGMPEKPEKRICNFAHFRGYLGGLLSDAQSNEVFENFNITCDKSVFLSEKGRNTITSKITLLLKKHNKRILLDRSVRNEIYQLYQSTKDIDMGEENYDKLNDDYRQAKAALNMIKAMQKNDLIVMCGAGYSFDNSLNCLQNIINNHKDNLFCVITVEQEFSSKLLSCTGENVITMKLRQDGILLFKACHHNLLRIIEVSNSGKTISNVQNLRAENGANMRVPQQNGFITNGRGTNYILGKEIAHGGEGTIYELSEGTVAKIYFENKIDEEKKNKLLKMMNINMPNQSICWPTELLYNASSTFIGFKMPECLNTKELGMTVLKAGNKAVREKLFPHWKRRDLVCVCKAISEIFISLHKNNIIMGDINARNILVSMEDSSKVYLIDCDSMQIGDYLCKVGTEIYTSPRIFREYGNNPNYSMFKRIREDDEYALATVLFQIMMVGQNPFSSKNSNNTISEAIKNHTFAFKTDSVSGIDTPDGPARVIWSNIPKIVKNAFEKVFTGKGTITASQWCGIFNEYLQLIEKGYTSNDIIPTLYKCVPGKENDFVDYFCDYCGEKRNMPREKYERLEEQGKQKYCSTCLSFFNRLKKQPTTLKCSECGRNYQGTEFDGFLIQQGKKKALCQKCLARVDVRCSNCGKVFSIRKKKFDELISLGKPLFCNECKDAIFNRR